MGGRDIECRRKVLWFGVCAPQPPTNFPKQLPATATGWTRPVRAAKSRDASRGEARDMLVAFSHLQATMPANDKRLTIACLKLG
jgi:hypothetical protein